MPSIKKLFQKSENSAKPVYIHSHMFGGIGLLARNPGDWACVLLSIHLYDGLQAAHEWKGALLPSHPMYSSWRGSRRKLSRKNGPAFLLCFIKDGIIISQMTQEDMP